MKKTGEKSEQKFRAFLAMCESGSRMSKCPRRQFGSLLVDVDGRVKGYGRNGTPSGSPNLCGGNYCLRDGEPCRFCAGTGHEFDNENPHAPCHHCNGAKIWSPAIESGTNPQIGCIHAEVNLIINSERRDLKNGTIYVNGEPCELCAKYICQSGITRLVHKLNGYSTTEGIVILQEYGIEVIGLE